jgi:peptidoglycan/LPS O-acetylase OafA/YrhL
VSVSVSDSSSSRRSSSRSSEQSSDSGVPQPSENIVEPTRERLVFRTDIAGIRGIAVMLVTLCHFGVPGFSGGFIGPDLFFVLSGYLITGLLVKEYARNAYDRSVRTRLSKQRKRRKRSTRGKIAVGEFYLRRARRILPASLFVLLCVNIYARTSLNPLQVAQIKSDSWWTLLFGANIDFLRQSTDYFAQTSTVSPLQHYWSLAVEEQFYLVWPLLFLTAINFHSFKYRGKKFNWQQRLFGVFTSVFVLSFVWMLVEFTLTPKVAYFSTFSRAWELALGGALSLIPVETTSRKLGKGWTLLRIFALVAMLGSIAFVTPSNFGYTLVVPAAAVGFLLMSGSVTQGDVVQRILSLKPFVALGAISFSVYLWHWPVFVFGSDLGLMDTLQQRLIGVAVCIALGTVSYWMIERTFLGLSLPKFKRATKAVTRLGLAKSRVFTVSMTAALVAVLAIITYPTMWSAGPAPSGWKPPVRSKVTVLETQVPSTKVASPSETDPLMSSANALREAVKSAILNPVEVADLALLRQIQTASFRLPDTLASKCSMQQTYLVQCLFGKANAPRQWLVTGDSFTEMWAEGFADLARMHPDIAVRFMYVEECPNSWTRAGQLELSQLSHPETAGLCAQLHNRVRTYIRTHDVERLIFSDQIATLDTQQRLSAYAKGFFSYVNTLAITKDRVRLLGSPPQLPEISSCANKKITNLSECSVPISSQARWINAQRQIAVAAKLKYVDVTDWLCYQGVCPAVVSNMMVNSRQHLNQTFGRKLIPLLYASIANS